MKLSGFDKLHATLRHPDYRADYERAMKDFRALVGDIPESEVEEKAEAFYKPLWQLEKKWGTNLGLWVEDCSSYESVEIYSRFLPANPLVTHVSLDKSRRWVSCQIDVAAPIPEVLRVLEKWLEDLKQVAGLAKERSKGGKLSVLDLADKSPADDRAYHWRVYDLKTYRKMSFDAICLKLHGCCRETMDGHDREIGKAWYEKVRRAYQKAKSMVALVGRK